MRPEPPPVPSPGDELVDLIDGQGTVVGRAPRRLVRAQNLPHRGVGILCWSPRGELYVHRRTATKDLFPGRYDMLVGGVVGAGESFDDAARREVGEELGVVGAPLRFLFEHVYRGAHNHARVAVYEVVWDGPIRHQESEVAWGTWMQLEELERRLTEWEFVPDGRSIWERWRAERAG